MQQLEFKMNNKNNIIYYLENRILLIVLLSYDISADAWHALRNEIASRHETVENSDVYIDYLLRNGLNDRYYKTTLNGKILQFNTAYQCNAPEECKIISDNIFRLNKELLDRGILSSRQKSTYLRHLQNNDLSYTTNKSQHYIAEDCCVI